MLRSLIVKVDGALDDVERDLQEGHVQFLCFSDGFFDAYPGVPPLVERHVSMMSVAEFLEFMRAARTRLTNVKANILEEMAELDSLQQRKSLWDGEDVESLQQQIVLWDLQGQ